jgi:energy-coupling factor transporter ATP-binding protein EcfA2
MLRRKIGFIFQYPEQQFFCETLEEELRYTMRLCGIPGDKQGECMTGALERAGLPPGTFLERSPFTLSFGESKRLAIAIASIMQPRLVLADEPTAGLDGSGTAFALRVLGDLHARGSTLLVASQDVDFLAELTTRIVILSDGRIAADGPSFDILGNEALLARFGYERPQIVVLMEEWKRQGVRLPAGVRRVSDLSRPGGQGVHTG